MSAKTVSKKAFQLWKAATEQATTDRDDEVSRIYSQVEAVYLARELFSDWGGEHPEWFDADGRLKALNG